MKCEHCNLKDFAKETFLGFLCPWCADEALERDREERGYDSFLKSESFKRKKAEKH